MIKMLREKLNNRPDLLKIAEIIADKASVLDLGCGSGSFLRLLREVKHIRGVGLEVDQEKISECINNGVNVIQSNLNTGLHFSDNSFDFVVLSRTLQAVDRPDLLLREILRVGNKGIISFINIGHYRARLQLAFGGRMPKTKILPSQWYDTENIHLCTIADFRALCHELNVKITQEIPLGHEPGWLVKLMPNLFAPIAIFVVESN
jgi:methionine biosynthesis protein MetW